MNDLEKLLEGITKRFVFDESFFIKCSGVGISPKDWPAFSCKETATRYEKTRLEKGHERAALVCAESVGNYTGSTHIEEIGFVIEIYKDLMLDHRGKVLAQKINNDPRNAAKYFSEYSSFNFEDDLAHFGSEIEKTYKESINQAASGDSEIVFTGWENLSSMIGGFNPGRVGMILAATGFGKTTLATNLALAAAKTKKVVYLNMEMIDFDFSQRLIMSSGEINYHDLKFNPEKQEQKIANVLREYLGKDLYFSRGKSMGIYEIISRCSEHKRNKGLDVVFVDYDQKINLETTRDVPEWKALQIAMESLEKMAKRLKVFVVLLTQENADGGVSGSRRSTFPASTVLRFYKKESDFVVQAIKNRFGKHNAMIGVNYDHAKNKITERGPLDDNESGAKKPKNIFGDINRMAAPAKARTPYSDVET